MNAASVPVSKYIANATHTGALQDQGSKVTKTEAPPEKQKPIVDVAPTPPPAPEAENEMPGLRQQVKSDGSQQFVADNGVKMDTSPEGQIQNIEVPGEGTIQRQAEGKMSLQTEDGKQVPVEAFHTENGEFLGYSFTRGDKTKVHVNLDNLSVAYQGAHGDIWQEVDATGGQSILINSSFKDPETGKRSQLQSHVYVQADGQVEHLDGYNKGLKVSAGKIEFRNPANFRTSIELPTPIASLKSGEAPAPQSKVAEEAAPDVNAPLLQEPPARPMTHAVIPSMVLFHRDEEGQTAIQLRNGMTLMHTKDRTVAMDARNGERLPAEVTTFTAADGRVENMFNFKDSVGNQYRMFDDSMDFLVESKDGKVRQHVLPDGTILGQIKSDEGKSYRFEITPKGQYKTDPGLQMTPSPSGQDVPIAYLRSNQNGPAVAVQLPYPIPGDQANAGQHADVFGATSYPQSGSKLPGFADVTVPPQVPPQAPPQAPPQNNGPVFNGAPPQGPTHNFDAGYLPYPGVPQQPMEPSMMQRLKYMFTGNPMDLQPKPHYQPPPPWMGGYNSGYHGMPPTGWPQQPQTGWPQQQPAGWPQGPGSIGGGVPSYPTPGAPPPNWTGAPPGAPGQMPGGNGMLDRMRAEYYQTDQMLMNQVMMGQQTTNMMMAGQMMHSMFNGFSMGMALMPSSYFFIPFLF